VVEWQNTENGTRVSHWRVLTHLSELIDDVGVGYHDLYS
jgi:hypothetical protein